MSSEHEHPFYGFDIIRRKEKDKINAILKKYKDEPVTEELKKRIWDELQEAKHQGVVTIPFKVAMRVDAYKKYPPYIEVILDTKV